MCSTSSMNMNTEFGDSYQKVGDYTSILEMYSNYKPRANILKLRDKGFYFHRSLDTNFGITKSPTISNSRRKDYKTFSIFSGVLSLIGLGETTLRNGRIAISDRRRYSASRMVLSSQTYDILVIGATKNPLGLTITSSTVICDKLETTIIVAKNKFWKNNNYVKKNYNSTIRGLVMKDILKLQSEGVNVEVMEDEEISNFIQKGVPLQTNSIMDIMNIEKRVLNNVFTNIRSRVELT